MTEESEKPEGTGAEGDLPVAPLSVIRNADLVERRRTQILDAALTLFLTKGFGQTTVRDICAASGVNQASFYDYVANKDDILRRLLNRMYTRPESSAIARRREDDDYPTVEAYLTDLYGHSWTVNREAILLTYRVIRDMDKQSRRAVLGRDMDLVAGIAALIRAKLALPPEDARVDVIANLVVFINGFMPLRDWGLKDVDRDFVVETIAAGVAAMTERLAERATEPDDTA